MVKLETEMIMYMKEKSRIYTDRKRHAKTSEPQPGDDVLLRQPVYNKTTTNYEHEPYKLISKHGNQVVVESPTTGVIRVRNSTHVKKFNSLSEVCDPKMFNSTVDNSSNYQDSVVHSRNCDDISEELPNSGVDEPSTTITTPDVSLRRSTRESKPPKRFGHYVKP